MTMAPVTSLAAVAVESLVRGGAKKALPPPPPSSRRGQSRSAVPSNDEGPYEAFMKLNEPLRFFISGNCGNVIFFYLEKVCFYILQHMKNLPTVVKEYMDSVSFFIAYVLQVIPQHWLHAYLVYGLDSINTREKYFVTLFGCYSAYMTSLVGSTLLNTFFVKTLEMNKTAAFITTLWTFAVINYFFIGWIVRRGQESAAPKVVKDARKAARDAQRAIAESRKKEQAKAKMVEAKMKAKAEQAKLKAKALEERMKAKAQLDKQKAKERAQKEKERAKAKADKEKADARKKAKTQVREVGNKAKKTNAATNKAINKARGGGSRNVRFQASLGSKDLLHAFVLSVGEAVDVE